MTETSIAYRGVRLHAPGTRKNNNHWIMRGRLGGRLVECTTRADTLEDAESFVDRFIPALLGVHQTAPAGAHDEPDKQFLASGDDLPKWAMRLRQSAKWRAAAHGFPFDLTRSNLLTLVQRAAGRCEVTGVPFSFDVLSRARRRPLIPSLDRIDPPAGYTLGNCRLVAFCVNVALSDWGDEVFRRIINAAKARQMWG